MNWDYLMGEKKTKKKKVQTEIKRTPIVPKRKTKSNKQIIEVHHFHHNIMEQKDVGSILSKGRVSQPKKEFNLSVLNGELSVDADRDGIPNVLDPNPLKAEPKKKLIYEKTLRSIYRDDKD